MKRRPVSLALLFVRDLRVAGWRRWGGHVFVEPEQSGF